MQTTYLVWRKCVDGHSQWHTENLWYYITKVRHQTEGKKMDTKQAIENVVDFLKENEQYGDDWSAEINELENILDSIETED